MAAKSLQVLLTELDQLLEETSWKGPPSDLSYLTPQHDQFFQQVILGGAYYDNMAQCIALQVEKTCETSEKVFRICSVGCGDGKLDNKILSLLVTAHPELEIEYVGVGLCEQACEEVLSVMEGIGEKVKVQVIAKDYSELSNDDVGTFNCVLMVSCLCYSVVPEVTLEAVLNLVDPSGVLVLVSSSRQSVDELIGRFWKHQRHYDLCTTEDVITMLHKIGRKYTMLQLPVTFDLSSCFKDEFMSEQSKADS